MPKQHTVLGRPIPRLSNRRLTLLLFGILFLGLAAISTLPLSTSSSQHHHPHGRHPVSRIKDSFSSNIFHPFRQPSHPPPRQKNDTYGGTTWWADWKWLSVPFSSTLTLDEDRALLPPFREKPPVYCYYDDSLKRTTEVKDAEGDLLLTWRRAWWAQGFRPVIISASESMNNPKYEQLQRIEVEAELKEDLMRWLAWETMGGGLLSQYTLLPMGSNEDPLLTYLRRGEYPQLTVWKGLDSGLVAGLRTDISRTIQAVFDSEKPTAHKSVLAAIPKDFIKVDVTSNSLAYYSPKIIKKRYFKLPGKNSFPEGIEVLKPFPEHTTTMIFNALSLSHSLISCPDSPIPSSCPPQLPKCQRCITDKSSMAIKTPSSYRNSSRVFTIGTVPHPWTLASMHNLRENLDIAWIRRESPRNAWLTAITQDLLGSKSSDDRRVMRFKQAVADDHAAAHAFWLTAEAEMPNDLDWHFGFSIPKQPGEKLSHGENEKTRKKKTLETTTPNMHNGTHELTPEEALVLEPILFNRAKQIIALSKPTTETRLRASLEAWNLADTEAWKFTRAFMARQSMEREKWEKDESKYSRGVGSERGRNAWSRWGDSKGTSIPD